MNAKHKIALVVVVLATAGLMIVYLRPAAGSAALSPADASGSRPQRVQSIPELQGTSSFPKWASLTDPKLEREHRLRNARMISEGVSVDQAHHLLSLLDHQPPEWNREDWWVVLNEIMGQLGDEGTAGDAYAARLSALIRDPSLPEVTRDYAIQHLSRRLAPVVADGTALLKQDVKAEGLDAIASAIKDPTASHTTIPGTGLLALAEISPRLEAGEAAKVWESIRTHVMAVVAGKTESGLPVRVSAIQAVAIRKDGAFLPDIRELAASRSANQSVRLSAIAALGIYGEHADVPLLEGLAGSGSPYQYAARAALARINR